MPNLFGLDIAKIVNDNLGGELLSLTLTQFIVGTRTAGQLTGGNNPLPVVSTGKGIIQDYEDRQIDGTLVLRGDRRVLILGGSLPAGVIPSTDNSITLEGDTFKVINVIRDPAAATYQCQVRHT